MAGTLGTELTPEERALFLDEAHEHLETLEQELLDMEREGVSDERVAAAFRSAHTIKGSAATVGLEEMALLTHAIESAFDQLRAGVLVASPPLITAALQAVDSLKSMLSAFERGVAIPAAPAGLIDQLTAPAPADDPGDESNMLAVRVTFAEDCAMPAVRALQVLMELEALVQIVRSQPSLADIEAERVDRELEIWLPGTVNIGDVERILAQIPEVAASDIVPAAVAAPDTAPVASAAPDNQTGGGGRAEARSIRVDVSLLDNLMNLVGELVIDRSRLAGIAKQLTDHDENNVLAADLAQVVAHLERTTTMLQDTVMSARMLPVDRVFRKVPRIVRDLAAQFGKQVELRIEGQGTQLDRSILEALGDPLLHLVRNAIDHGIELPAEREQAGKRPQATLRLAAEHFDNHVLITVADDGAGINVEKIRQKAVARGLVTAEAAAALPEREVLNLLFRSGFSTAEQVTEVSGRGVGLDVVRREIERVGGQVSVQSEGGKGTSFLLQLPLTLATMRALLIAVNGETFALPLTTVQETLRVPAAAVQNIMGHPVVVVRGQTVYLIPLNQVLGTANTAAGTEAARSTLTIVMVARRDACYGLIVDELLGDREIVVKGVDQLFGRVEGMGGVTVLEDGTLGIILDVEGLLVAYKSVEVPAWSR